VEAARLLFLDGLLPCGRGRALRGDRGQHFLGFGLGRGGRFFAGTCFGLFPLQCFGFHPGAVLLGDLRRCLQGLTRLALAFRHVAFEVLHQPCDHLFQVHILFRFLHQQLLTPVMIDLVPPRRGALKAIFGKNAETCVDRVDEMRIVALDVAEGFQRVHLLDAPWPPDANATTAAPCA
jgi:hypothetical protein